jgi:hypothetical protein
LIVNVDGVGVDVARSGSAIFQGHRVFLWEISDDRSTMYARIQNTDFPSVLVSILPRSDRNDFTKRYRRSEYAFVA